MSFVRVLRDRVRHHLVLQSVSDLLERVGISVIPYYVFEESVSSKLGVKVEPALRPVVAGFLSHSEIEQLCFRPECWELALDRDKLLRGGCQCFALKHNGEIVAYMLCDFLQCDSRLLSFPLGQDESYLYGIYTFPAYRGKNLAAVLENELYKRLDAVGRKRYYSINILFNTPGLKFKRKLHSRPLMLRLYISLFNKSRWNVTLRRYRGQAASSTASAVAAGKDPLSVS